MDQVDCIVVGAGVVGLAVARTLARSGRDVIVLEAAGAIGTGTSSRNSEVIHAGIYYPPGSLKARLCVEGRDALYAFCADFGVSHRRLGKLIVALAPEERDYLTKLMARAAANGVTDLRLLEPAELAEIEPALKAECAVLSPSTGIVDSHGYMVALQGDIEAHGGAVALNAPFERGEALPGGGFRVETGGDAPLALGCRILVNCAGLDAQAVAHRIAGLDPRHVPGQELAKGNYFVCARRAPFQHLIYPVPERGGLGTHLTLDLGGQARFGPDVEWITERTYEVDPARGAAVLRSVQRFWPELTAEDLAPGYAGIRPKLPQTGSEAPDFVISDAGAHGLDGLVNLFGIESPGLTSSLAIGAEVARRLGATVG